MDNALGARLVPSDVSRLGGDQHPPHGGAKPGDGTFAWVIVLRCWMRHTWVNVLSRDYSIYPKLFGFGWF